MDKKIFIYKHSLCGIIPKFKLSKNIKIIFKALNTSDYLL